jgi:outer membrane protein TolC
MIKSIPQVDRLLRNKISTTVAVLLLILPVVVEAGEDSGSPYSHSLTLHDCIAIALGESPALEASRYDIAAASEEVRATQDMLLPQVTGQAGYQLFSGSPTGKFSVVNLGNNGGVAIGSSKGVDLAGVQIYSANLQYPLFREGSIFGLNNGPAIASKKAKREALAWTLNLRREDVVYRIADEFIATVSAQNRSGLVTRRVELLEQSVAITEEQQKQGLMLPIDLKVAQDQLSGARTLAKILRQQIVAGQLELSRSLGLTSPSKLRLVNILPDPPDPPTAEQLLGASLNRHPSVQVQRALTNEAREDYRLERYRLYPSVSLNGSANYIDDFSPSNATVYSGVVVVSIPIFDFGAQLATARSRLMKYRTEQAKILSVADDVTYEVLKSYQAIYTLSQNILSLQDEVSKAQRDMQVTSSQQEQGIAPPLTAIERELHFIAKQDDLEGLKARRLTLYATLQRAAGGAWKWTP